ncbi:MAG: antitoxin [Mycobacteriales bacterium]
MGLFDKIKDAAEKAIDEHPDQLAGAVDKATDFVDDKTGGKHHDRLEQADDKARAFVEERSVDEGSADERSVEEPHTPGS